MPSKPKAKPVDLPVIPAELLDQLGKYACIQSIVRSA